MSFLQLVCLPQGAVEARRETLWWSIIKYRKLSYSSATWVAFPERIASKSLNEIVDTLLLKE